MEKTLRVVSVADMAVDIARTPDVAKYMRERVEADVAFLPDKRPTWFHVKRIDTNVFMTYVQVASSEPERRRRAFQVGVELVENPPPPLTGTQFAPETVHGSFGRHTLYSDEDIAQLPVAYVEEIGELCYQRAFLVPGSGATFVPLPSSLRVLKARIFQAAERRREESQFGSAAKEPAAPAS